MAFEDGRITDEQATLPERFETPGIGSILPGEMVFVSTSTLWFDHVGNAWLHQDDGYSEEVNDRHALMVARVEAGFAAVLFGQTTKWQRHRDDYWDEEDAGNSLPVVALITTEIEQALLHSELASIGNLAKETYRLSSGLGTPAFLTDEAWTGSTNDSAHEHPVGEVQVPDFLLNEVEAANSADERPANQNRRLSFGFGWLRRATEK